MTEDYKKGEAAARDYILCLIIGLQNDCTGPHDERYMTLQYLLELIEKRCGPMMSEYKG